MKIVELSSKILNIYTLDVTAELSEIQEKLVNSIISKFYYELNGNKYLLISEEYTLGFFNKKKEKKRILENIEEQRSTFNLKGLDLVKDNIIISKTKIDSHIEFGKQLTCFLSEKNPLVFGLYPYRLPIKDYQSNDIILFIYDKDMPKEYKGLKLKESSKYYVYCDRSFLLDEEDLGDSEK